MKNLKAEVNRPGFMVYFETLDALDEYTDAEKGQFVTAMRDYAKDSVIPSFEDRGLRSLWKITQQALDKDRIHYADRCQKNRYNAYTGAIRKKFEKNPANVGKVFTEGIHYLSFADWIEQIDSPPSSFLGSDRVQSVPTESQYNCKDSINHNISSTETLITAPIINSNSSDSSNDSDNGNRVKGRNHNSTDALIGNDFFFSGQYGK